MHTKKEKRNICADFTVCSAAVPPMTGLLLWVMCSCSIFKVARTGIAVHAGVTLRHPALWQWTGQWLLGRRWCRCVETQHVSDLPRCLPPCRDWRRGGRVEKCVNINTEEHFVWLTGRLIQSGRWSNIGSSGGKHFRFAPQEEVKIQNEINCRWLRVHLWQNQTS